MNRGRAGRSPLPALLFLVPLIAVLACTSITTRPSYRALPMAPADTVQADPSDVIAFARQWLVQEGLRIRVSSAPEGYIETRWYHPRTRRSYRQNNDPKSLFRVRVWADLVTPVQSGVIVESTYRPAVDPSVPPRVDEMVAPPASPGDSVAVRLLAAVTEQFAAAAGRQTGR